MWRMLHPFTLARALIGVLIAASYHYFYRSGVKVSPSFIKTGESLVVMNTCPQGRMEIIADKGVLIHDDYWGYERKSVEYDFAFMFDRYADRTKMVFNNIFYDYYSIYGKTELLLDLHGGNYSEGYFILEDDNGGKTPFILEDEIRRIINNGTGQCKNVPNYVHFMGRSNVTVNIMASKPMRVSLVFFCDKCTRNKVSGSLRVKTFYPVPSKFADTRTTTTSIIHRFDNYTVLSVPESDSTTRYVYSSYCSVDPS